MIMSESNLKDDNEEKSNIFNKSCFSYNYIPNDIALEMYEDIKFQAYNNLITDEDFITENDLFNVISNITYNGKADNHFKILQERFRNGEINDDFMEEIDDITDRAIKDLLNELGYEKNVENDSYSKFEELNYSHNIIEDYLKENNINYEVSRSIVAGPFPSIYIFDNEGNELMRIANHKNGRTTKGVYTNEELLDYNKIIEKINNEIKPLLQKRENEESEEDEI